MRRKPLPPYVHALWPPLLVLTMLTTNMLMHPPVDDATTRASALNLPTSSSTSTTAEPTTTTTTPEEVVVSRSPSSAIAITTTVAPPPTTTTTAQATLDASEEGIPAKWLSLADCESGDRINHPDGTYTVIAGTRRWHIADSLHSGGVQFAYGTWRQAGGGRFASAAHLASPQQQIQVAREWLARTSPGQWPECGRKVGLSMADA